MSMKKKITATNNFVLLRQYFSPRWYVMDQFSWHEQKIVFGELFGIFFRMGLSFLEAELYRFFKLQLSWYTLYNWRSLKALLAISLM